MYSFSYYSYDHEGDDDYICFVMHNDYVEIVDGRHQHHGIKIIKEV